MREQTARASSPAPLANRAHETVVQTFGAGLPVPTGTTLELLEYNEFGSVNLYGYLVPASQVPASLPDVTAAGGPTPTGTR